jgi:DNA-binding CsgD family transcriptional regulator
MEQMTHGEKANEPARVAPERPLRSRRRDALLRWGPPASFAFIALAVTADLASDVADGVSVWHLLAEGFVVALALVGFGVLWREVRSTNARALGLERDLDGTRADLARWRGEAQEHLRGLSTAIDSQLRRWELTPAEREVALLLLKGLSLKEIADLRSTSERTVRQQSLGIYRKSGLAGRAELAAFFLEDLLLPADGARGAG